MLLKVNGVTIPQDAIDREKQFHDDSPDPERAARCALAIRELLLQRACAVGLANAREALTDAQCEAAIEALCAREAPTPEPTEEECRRYYESHRSHYRSGDLVEAAHILFAVTPGAPIEAVRRQAESTLKQARQAPERFADLAAALSNCPSGAQGGNLGQVTKGQTTAEFERALQALAPGELCAEPVATRYGFHVIRLERRIDGRQVPYEAVAGRIADYLRESVRRRADAQYIARLASAAQIEGIELASAEELRVH